MNIHMPFLSAYLPEPRIHKEARTLSASGHTVTVLALWQPGQVEEEEIEGYTVQRLRLYSLRWRGRLVAPLVKWVEFNLRVWMFCLGGSPDVIHAHDAKALFISWLCAKLFRARLIYDARELETSREFGSFRLASIYRHMWSLPETLFIRATDAVITVSEAIADELVRLYHIKRPVVIMNCPERYSPSPSDRLHQELNIPTGLRIALYQGVISAGYGIEPFIEAVRYLPNVVAVILGDGPLFPKLKARQLAGELPHVYLVGRVPMDALPSYLSCADVGVTLIQDTCLSHRYSLPNKLFEYIQAGLPVVASNLPEMARLVREYGVGELVNPDDPQDIADGIRRLLDDPQRYAQAQANTRQAAAILNWDHEKAKLLELYFQIDKQGKS